MKILLALDRSTNSMSAAKFLRTFPVPPDSSVYLFHVTETPNLAGFSQVYDIPHLEQQIATMRMNIKEKASVYFSKIQRLYQSQGITMHQVVRDGIPGAEIMNFIEAERIDLVVMGRRGLSNLKRFLLGSVSEWVIADAPCSVVVVRPLRRKGKTKRKAMHFLLATDGSEDARSAAHFLGSLQPPGGSVLTIVHVVDSFHEHMISRVLSTRRGEIDRVAKDLLKLRKERGVKILGETSHELRKAGWQVRESLLVGHPADQILKASGQACPDLIVLGSRGLTGMRRFFLGSVSHKVVRNAPASVLVVRAFQR
jgi:nucleotide-binding universal stress UspA family protein